MDQFKVSIRVILVITLGLSSNCLSPSPVNKSGLNALELSDSNYNGLKLFYGEDFIYEDTISMGIYVKIIDQNKISQLIKLRNPEIEMYTDSGMLSCAPLNIFRSVVPESPFYFNVDMQGRIVLYTEENLLFLHRTIKNN